MKTKRVLIQIGRIVGLIMAVIGCIISIPSIMFGLMSVAFVGPGVKLWQVTSDALDEDDKDPIEIEIACGCSSTKCAK